jgi:hypothetical protein
MVKPKQKLFAFTLMLIMLIVYCEAKISLNSFKVGAMWKYESLYEMEDIGTLTGEMEKSILPWRKIGNQKVLPWKYSVSLIVLGTKQNMTVFYYMAEDEHGIYSYARQGPEDLEPELIQGKEYRYKHPIKVGNSWDYSNDNGEYFRCSIIAEEEITVPAGNFKCFKFEYVGKEEIEGELFAYKEYDWVTSSGVTIKSYKDVPGNYSMLFQLSSASKIFPDSL